MIEVYKTENRKLRRATYDEKDIWISLTSPTRDELQEVVDKVGAIDDFLTAPLDPEELSRLETDEDTGQVLILVNAALEEKKELDSLHYNTVPVGIILLKDVIITVTLTKIDCVEYFKEFPIKNLDTSKKTRFSLQIIYQMTNHYITALRKIDRFSAEIESHIGNELDNAYLIQLLHLEKNLLYFSTSVRGNENVVRRITRVSMIKKYEEDEELLEDTLIELQQAWEMINTDLNILKRIRDTFSSVINNNQNLIMKTLTSFTIILTISSVVFSFYGMNTDFGDYVDHVGMAYIILFLTLFVTWIIYLIMKRKNLW